MMSGFSTATSFTYIYTLHNIIIIILIHEIYNPEESNIKKLFTHINAGKVRKKRACLIKAFNTLILTASQHYLKYL